MNREEETAGANNSLQPRLVTNVSSRASRGGNSNQEQLHQGKWTHEEEAYANFLIEEFRLGNLSIPSGTTLRGFLARKLDCLPKRVSKKFENTGYNGKQHYNGKTVHFNPRESELRKLKLEQLRQDFVASRNRTLGKTGSNPAPSSWSAVQAVAQPFLGQQAPAPAPTANISLAQAAVESHLASNSMEQRLQAAGMYSGPASAAAAAAPVAPSRSSLTGQHLQGDAARMAALERMRNEQLRNELAASNALGLGGATPSGLGPSVGGLGSLASSNLMEEELLRSALASNASLSRLSLPNSLLPPSAISRNMLAMASLQDAATNSNNMAAAAAAETQRRRSLLAMPTAGLSSLSTLQAAANANAANSGSNQLALMESSGRASLLAQLRLQQQIELEGLGQRASLEQQRLELEGLAAGQLRASLPASLQAAALARAAAAGNNTTSNAGKRRNSAPSDLGLGLDPTKRSRFF